MVGIGLKAVFIGNEMTTHRDIYHPFGMSLPISYIRHWVYPHSIGCRAQLVIHSYIRGAIDMNFLYSKDNLHYLQ